ncbi:helix-turn-helix domain-containing protein [Microbulbifer sp. A4B17]|uniref:helix-turn-helix domain-containing protein n=1 Tax=Microbulbifer sp. A4B17 TaxID=359370 RepID=UPI00192D640D|nr:helix-turn-helix transcriptional regulator [Microbulbifer sp. A4B17]
MKVNAELIAKLRKGKSWSQEELAIASGLNLRTIQRIEKEASASLQSRKALASALDIDVQDLDYEEKQMKPCPECKSENVYKCKEYVDTTTIGGELLPKLSSSMFSSAKTVPVICGDCGYLRNFVSEEALKKLKGAKNWEKI